MGQPRSMACSLDNASFCKARRSGSDRFRMLTGFRITLRPLTLHHVHGPCNTDMQNTLVVNSKPHSATWINKIIMILITIIGNLQSAFRDSKCFTTELDRNMQIPIYKSVVYKQTKNVNTHKHTKHSETHARTHAHTHTH